MLRIRASLFIASVTTLLVGCVSVKAPERINMQGHRPRTGHSSAPRTSSLPQCQEELAQAYDELTYLRDKVARLEHDNDKLDHELDACEDRLDRYEDRYDD